MFALGDWGFPLAWSPPWVIGLVADEGCREWRIVTLGCWPNCVCWGTGTGPGALAAIMADIDAFSSSRSGVNWIGPRNASSRTNSIAERVRRETRRGRSSKRVSEREGSSDLWCRAGLDTPRRYSPLVGVGDDEDGEESEEVDKLAVMGIVSGGVKFLPLWKKKNNEAAKSKRASLTGDVRPAGPGRNRDGG